MASREELESLRQLARKRHRAVTQKVSRIKAKEGITLTGTKDDPRKDPQSFKRMNAIQLRAHIAKQETFISRETQFVSGAKGTILTGSLWHQAETLIRAVNRKNATPYEAVKNVFLPSQGMTVDEFMGTKPTHPVTGNPASRAPHLPITKSAKGIPNDRQLKKLIKDLQAKLATDYGDKVIARERKTLGKFLKDIGKVSNIKDISKDFRGLTPGQFAFMWNYTNFAAISSFDYEIAKSKLHDPKSLSQFDNAFTTQISEMRKIIKDVKGLDF